MGKLTSALIALGMVSVASVAMADSTVTIGGLSYAQIFITGSTAARANVFNAVNTPHAGAAQPAGTGGLFDALPNYVTANPPPGPAPTGSTGNYTAYGTINGTRYCLCFSWTGSEAGLWAIQHNANGIPNPVLANTLGGNAAFPNAVIPGTPNPTSFIDPNTGNSFSAAADIAMSDTSQAVSLSASPALHDFGIVGAITFEWVKAKNSAPDAAFNDLVNVEGYQMNALLAAPVTANYITGVAADSSDFVFMTGRNKASGTHQNAMLVTQHGTTTAVDQWVVNNAGYNTSGVLTNGPIATLTVAGGLTEVFNDGYDSGGNVATTLQCDTAGVQNINSGGSTVFTTKLILLSYPGVNDAKTAILGGAVGLTFNGVPENDATVIEGSYPHWGHEHLYSVASPDAGITQVAQALAGNVLITAFGTGTPNGAIAAAGAVGGGEANPAATQSGIIGPQFMKADKPSGGDAGFPSPL